MKPVLLLDVDGVLADFVGGTIRTLRSVGVDLSREDVTAMDIFKGDKALEAAFKHKLSTEGGFCSRLEPLHGAAEFVERARDVYDVVIVTAPYDVVGWCDERIAWIQAHLGLPRSSVVFAHRKELVAGDALVEDSARNASKWAKAHPEGSAILVDQPWNRVDDGDFVRVYDFDDVGVALAAAGLPKLG